MKKVILFILFFNLIIITKISGQSISDISQLENLSKKYYDSKIFYNLGILYAENGNTGKAILNLKRSYLLNSNDRDIKTSLNTLRNTIGIPPYLLEQSPIETAVLFLFTFLNINVNALLGIIFLMLGSTGLSASFARFFPAFINRLKTASIILITAGIIYILSSAARYTAAFNKKNAVVINQSQLLERPDFTALKITDIIPGMECSIKNKMGGFFLINTLDGHEGWIIETNLSRLWGGV